MKADFLSCTKQLYVAEKLLRDGFFNVYEINENVAKQFDMSIQELRAVWDQFEHGKLLVLAEMSAEIDDGYGDISSEITYDVFTVEKKELGKYIQYLKERYRLRDTPFVPREAIVSIASQISKVLGKEELIRAVAVFSRAGDAAQCLYNGTYSLADFLFRHAYAAEWIEPLPKVLAEFFNPIYYGIDNKKTSADLFEYIDGIIVVSAKPQDYEAWRTAAAKYVSVSQKREQKVIHHEYTHRFENSIQEKSIDLNHKFGSGKKGGFYITKKGDDFSYKGRYINLSKKTDYYKVFSALYAKLPNGGEISYKDLTAEIKSRLHHKTDEKTNKEMQKFIQRNLTDKNNGFMRYAGIPETEDNGKPLIEVNRGNGIVFNNKTG